MYSVNIYILMEYWCVSDTSSNSLIPRKHFVGCGEMYL